MVMHEAGGPAVQYSLENVWKICETQTDTVTILSDANLTVCQGEQVAIVGASGSGKSTLLHLMGALDTPTKGSLRFEGMELGTVSPKELAELRNKRMGFVFQFHHLLPEFSTVENVAMPALIGGMARSEALGRAEKALERVELSHRLRHKVTTLSGGERQRAAIARAILLEPAVLLADEPTGNLDQRTGATVGHMLMDLNRDLGMTLVIVTHNADMAKAMDRCIEIKAGALYEKNS